MNHILLLTKNIEYEQKFYEKIRMIGYEIFISKNCLSYLNENRYFPIHACGFSIVILSETLSKAETNKVLELFRNKELMVFLKTESISISKGERKNILEKGYGGILSNDSNLSEISGVLERCISKKRMINLENGSLTKIITNNQKELHLTKIDQDIFNTLKKNGSKVSRMELSKIVWGKCNNSTLSQLSLRVKKLNLLISQNMGIDQAIVTEWGKGYHFSSLFYNDYLKDL